MAFKDFSTFLLSYIEMFDEHFLRSKKVAEKLADSLSVENFPSESASSRDQEAIYAFRRLSGVARVQACARALAIYQDDVKTKELTEEKKRRKKELVDTKAGLKKAMEVLDRLLTLEED